MQDITLTVTDEQYHYLKDEPVNASQLFRQTVNDRME